MDYRLKSKKVILVTGATGHQGGAVATQLASASWHVRAFVRDSNKPAAKALAVKGIEVVTGDLNDRSTIDRALEGVYGVFCVLSWHDGVETEITQGRNIVDAAKKAGIKHFVYSSVGGAERMTGIPHFESKWKIEEYLRGSGIPSTIFRPVFMMYNFERPEFQESLAKGSLVYTLKPHKPLQMLAVEDLAVFVTMAFENPAQYTGKAVELAGDELTMPQIATALGKSLGRPIMYLERPFDAKGSAGRETAVMVEWFNKEGYRADIKALRALYPGLMTFEEWLLARTAQAKSA